MSSNNWNLNFPLLSKHFLCVAWDTRGYGESEDYEGELSFNDIINDLYTSYDLSLNSKYKVKIFNQTIDRVKNYFR